MRLIDTDEIKKREHDVVLVDGANHRCFDTTRLYEIPTVDAIPIEFIRKWVLANGYKRQSGWFITLRNLEKLIKDWEADNETD